MKNLNEIEARREAPFKDAVLSAAEAKKVAIIAEAQRQSDILLKQAAQACQLADHDLITRGHTQNAQREHAGMVQAARAELLQLREEMVEDLFARVEARLEAFRGSAAYAGWLRARLEKHAGAGAHTVYIGPGDEPQKEMIAQVMPGCHVEITRGIRLGGAKVSDGRVLYDETLDGALQEEKELFYQNSGLTVA